MKVKDFLKILTKCDPEKDISICSLNDFIPIEQITGKLAIVEDENGYAITEEVVSFPLSNGGIG